MQKYYTKNEKTGRYNFAGYNIPDLHEGIWFVQREGGCKRTTSIPYWAGRLNKDPIDLDLLTKIMSLDCKLAAYLGNLENENSEEFLEETDDAYKKVPPTCVLYNWSRQEYAQTILRFVYEELSKG
jgi:hypothetical protein